MSRAYRITLKESSTRQIQGSDEICTELEVLEILPKEQMGELLKRELEKRGYKDDGEGKLSRKDGNITITIDPKTCEVSVRSDVNENVTLESKGESVGYDDAGPGQTELKERLKKQLQEDLERKASRASEQLQGKATAELEEKLCDLQPELNEVVNKITREALKEKAQQLGSVKEVSEDEASGSLTIKIEV
jgi:hypothetical protein